MTKIQASNLNLRSGSEMVPLSNWTFGDFSANLVAGQMPFIDGYLLSIRAEDDEQDPDDLSKRTLYLEAKGIESGNTYIFAIGDVNGSSASGNTTYTLFFNNQTKQVILFDNNGNDCGHFTLPDIDLNLSWDEQNKQLVFEKNGQTNRITISQLDDCLDNTNFLKALFS